MNQRESSCSHPNLYNLEEKDQKQDEKNIKILIEERESLIKAKNLIEHLIKFIETILITYFKNTANYSHYININNLAGYGLKKASRRPEGRDVFVSCNFFYPKYT